MQWVVEEKGENRGDYSDKIKSEQVSKRIYANTEYQWEWVLFEETRRQEGKVKADWIKDGVGDSFDAATNQLILFWSELEFDPTKVMGKKICHHLPRRLTWNCSNNKWTEGRWGQMWTSWNRSNVLI